MFNLKNLWKNVAGVVKEKKTKTPSRPSAHFNDREQTILQEANNKAREVVLEAKDEAFRIKKQAEDESRRLREELAGLQQRLAGKEELAEKRTIVLDQKDQQLEEKKNQLELKIQEIEKIKQDQLAKLERAANLTVEDAKTLILQATENRLKEEVGKKIRDAEATAKDEADKKAKEIIVTAMLHGATDYVPEYTVSVVRITDEEVKGRIIGKEGRNIRTLEQVTGVDFDLDESGVIRLSSFDGIRREIARVALEKLIADGRIQPVKIEEIVDHTKKDIERIIKEEGEKLCQTLGVYNLPLEIISLLGRFKYRSSYGQNMIAHTLEETKIGIALAQEIKADVTVVRMGCILHDIGKVIVEEEGGHVNIGVETLKKYGIQPSVIACVAEHHEDKPFSSIESMIVYIADAISGSRPGARYEDYDKYVQRMESLEKIAKEFGGVKESWIYQAGREMRVLVDPEKMTDNEAVKLAHDIKKSIEEKIKEFPGQIKVTVIRELRTVVTAK